MTDASKIDTTLNEVLKTTPSGDVDRAIGATFYGINHRQQPNPVPINRDMIGLTFFTRPQLNLSRENVRAERSLIPLLTNAGSTIPNMVRHYLDPRLSVDDLTSNCPMVDNQNPFIPLLTNHMLSCTGWPDPMLDVYTSKPGVYKEVFQFVDSAPNDKQSFSLSLSFRNMEGDPITELFRVWYTYMHSVFRGTMVPYPDFMILNEIDYQTRVYRLILDKNRNTVQKIGCCGVAFPVTLPLGAAFNVGDVQKPLTGENDQISMQLNAVGFRYQDDLVLHDFNDAVGIFNPAMRSKYFVRDKNGITRNMFMQKIPPEALFLFNNSGYPRIDPYARTLDWYAPIGLYAQVINNYNRHIAALKPL